jgi:RND family efflux transporter MFP subunit
MSGPLRPKVQVTIRAQVEGTVSDLTVDRGSRVRRAQRLATIAAVGVRSQAAGARAAVAAAESNLALARQRLEAARRLRDAGGISDIDYQTAATHFQAAEAQLEAARAQLASASEAAGHTQVVAPVDGVVSERMVEEGEQVKSGDNVMTVVDTRVLELAARIGAADASRVRVGQPVRFTIDAFPGQEFTGRVARMDPIADPATRQVGVYVELPNPSGRIIGGLFAWGRISLDAMRAVVIPATAVQVSGPDSSITTAFVIENGRLVRRQVTLGPRDEERGLVAVLSGIAAGDRVLATPTAGVSEGAPVTMATDAPPRDTAVAAPKKE